LGFGFWVLGIGPNPQSPIPNPRVYIYNYIIIYNNFFIKFELKLKNESIKLQYKK